MGAIDEKLLLFIAMTTYTRPKTYIDRVREETNACRSFLPSYSRKITTLERRQNGERFDILEGGNFRLGLSFCPFPSRCFCFEISSTLKRDEISTLSSCPDMARVR